MPTRPHPVRRVTGVLLALAACAAAAPAAQAAAPTDPQAGGQEPLSILRVPQALDAAGRPLQDVPVLVADTGLDLDHPDIAPRLFANPQPGNAPNPDGVPPKVVPAGAPGWDLLGSAGPGQPLAPDGDPSDPSGGSGHGTLVAGILGAAWNNGAGGAGVAPNARFVALRTCWDDDQCYQYIQASAIGWASTRGARVASFSWLSGPLENELRDAITQHAQTLFVTIPSGNGGASDVDGEDPQPCGLDAPNVLCVTTSAPDDGLDCGGYGARAVDVAVPTRNTVTTTKDGGFTTTGCATSFAAPTAAGIATILFGIDPTATPADVKAAIVDSARKVPAWSGKSVSGGVADAEAAVRLFQERRGIPAGTAPGTGTTPGGPTTPTTGTDRTKPVLTLRRRGASRRAVRLSLRTSEPATVRLTIERRGTGRRVGRTCRATSAANRRRPRCTRWSVRRSTSVALAAGKAGVAPAAARTVSLPLVDARRRALPRGSYRVVARTTDRAGNVGTARRLTLRVR
jgi:hypothetical protein